MDAGKLAGGSSRYPRPVGLTHEYGTAGFRACADNLDSVFFAVGLLAGLRSKALGGQVIGIMMTASHNPEQDNGVKLVDPNGEMLISTWEKHATSLANSLNLSSSLEHIIDSENIQINNPSKVIYAYDTRASAPRLVRALKDGLSCFVPSVEIIESGLKTTPQLHYLVKCLNDGGQYGVATEEGYYQKLTKAFKSINQDSPAGSESSILSVDCANGVGAPKLALLNSYISDSFLKLHLVSTDIHSSGKLNKECGADYVKTSQSAPKGIELQPLSRYCSFDGDADRVVYYYSTGSRFRLMDGDKICGLVASYIKDLIDLESPAVKEKVKLGVVQTAYANGSSTRYITEILGLPVTCTSTGVKYLHHAAKSFDIGVYFEANGHGTVLFSDSLHNQLPSSSKLLQLASLINQTVGDSISDMLLVETILHQRGWSIEEWDKAYDELPNKLLKLIVPDRKCFVTEDAERRLVEPRGMQEKLDKIVDGYKLGRSFVRPSGTEDCVRVYAEAATRELVDALAAQVAALVQHFSDQDQ